MIWIKPAGWLSERAFARAQDGGIVLGINLVQNELDQLVGVATWLRPGDV